MNSSDNSGENKPRRSVKSVLGGLHQELMDAAPNAPITARQALVLVNSLVILQNVLVSVMDTADENTRVMNESHANTNQNFINLLNVCKRLANELGIEIVGVNSAADAPKNVTKH